MKRGKKEEYIKDEGSMIRYLMRMATADMTVKSAGANRSIEGKELAQIAGEDGRLQTLLRARGAPARRRLRICSIRLLEAFGGKKGVLRKEGTTLRKVFQDGDLMAKVEGVLAKAGYKTELID